MAGHPLSRLRAGAGAIRAAARQQDPWARDPHAAAPPLPLAWQLRCQPVCASTERQLERWLQRLPPQGPPLRAVVARQQRFGQGQQGRPWLSPPGGVWLSAALPWPAQPEAAASLALAVSVGLLLELEPLLERSAPQGWRLGLKWPNDLLLASPAGGWHKLAGVLPRLRWRGAAVRWAQVGVGLNGTNPVPAPALALAAALGPRHPALGPARLAARVLRGLAWAGAHAKDPEQVRQLAEARWVRPAEPVWHQECWWQPISLAVDGSLVLVAGDRRCLLQRQF